ncbi:MAG: primosomal protein N' [Clostridia bacterium]
MKVCAVIIVNTVRSYDRIYHYLVPSHLEQIVETGKRVSVPFGRGNALRTAYFLDFVDAGDTRKLKAVSDVIDGESVATKDMFRLARMIRDKYFCTYGQALNAMIPSGLKVKRQRFVVGPDGIRVQLEEYLLRTDGDRQALHRLLSQGQLRLEEESVLNISAKTLQHVRLAISPEEALDMTERGEFSNEKQIRLTELLVEYGEVGLADLENYEGISRTVVRTMAKKNIVQVFDKEVARQEETMGDLDTTVHESLTGEQTEAVERISEALSGHRKGAYLLHGVTGSGKTEVYMRLAEKALEAGRDIIVLVPEISLTPMMIRRFVGRFGDLVAVLHSRLSMGERLDQWKKLNMGTAKIGLGARSCIFAPLKNLGLVIIDEEHDPSYKSENTPRYDARDVAHMRCGLEGAVLVLGSATPSVETYHRMDTGGNVIRIEQRIHAREKPKARLVDMRQELAEGNRSIFSRILQQEIRENLERKDQTLLFINRRGYSSFYLCRTCGETVKCRDCDVSLTYHKTRNMLVCHYCGYAIRPVNACPSCTSTLIKDFGIGTQKVEEEVRDMFPSASVIRMDLDTTGYKNSHMRILDTFKNEKIDILIGTQMIAKGHDFPDITLVGVLCADTLTQDNSHDAQEKSFQLLTQAIGRSGRGSKEGKAVIQAYNTGSYAIDRAMEQDYEGFYKLECGMRQALSYPPFGYVGRLVFSGKNNGDVKAWADKAYGLATASGLEASRPVYAPVSRIRNAYRYRMVVKSDDPLLFHEEIRKIYFYAVRKFPAGVHLSIETDGLNMV